MKRTTEAARMAANERKAKSRAKKRAERSFTETVRKYILAKKRGKA